MILITNERANPGSAHMDAVCNARHSLSEPEWGIAMVDILIQPAAWLAALSLAGVLLAIIGLTQLEQARTLAAGMRTLPTRWGMTGRLALGHLAAIPLAALPALLIVSTHLTGMPRMLLAGASLALYLYVAIVLPRKPITSAQRERRQLRQLTPSFVSYIRVALAGYDSPPVLLERYLVRPHPRRAMMQQVVAEALGMMRDRGILPFDALRRVAREHGCIELIVVAESLAQAESEGSDPQLALQAQEATLNQILQDEFRQTIERRKLYLLALAALAVVSVLIQIMFVIVVGSGALNRI